MTTQNKVFVNRSFNCSASELFQWLVNPKLLAKWFGPKSMSIGNVHTEVRVGGTYDIELIKPDKQTFNIQGKYVEIDKPQLLTFTLIYKGLSNIPPQSIVKIKLNQIASQKTELSLTQDFEITPSDIENRTAAWKHMLRVLSNHFQTS